MNALEKCLVLVFLFFDLIVIQLVVRKVPNELKSAYRFFKLLGRVSNFF